MRKMSKKAKAEGYDDLSRDAERMRLILHDIASLVGEDAMATEIGTSTDSLDRVVCQGRAWRLTGADGGLCLLSIWTINPDGEPSTKTTRVMRLDDMRTGRSAYERAIGACGDRLREFRAEKFNKENR